MVDPPAALHEVEMAGPALFVTSYGRPAAELLRERVAAAKSDDPLHPVTVLVPTNYVGVSVRRLLATGALGPITTRGDGVAGLALLTVYRLAELLGAPALAAAGRRPVSTPLIAAAVRQILLDAPGIFAPVAEHASTEEALVGAHRELSALRPASLDTLQRQGRRAGDVVRIHRAVRERLADDWYEEADLMASAQRAVAAGSAVLDDLGTVIVYLPEDLSLPAADLISAVAGRGAVEVVAGLTGAAQADADVVRSLRRLGVEPPGQTSCSEAVGHHVGHPTPPVADEVVSVSDAEEEARSAVERVIAGARAGVALERMAILYPDPDPYARILHEQLAAAGIAYSGAAVRPLAERLIGRWLLDLLALPNRDFDRPSVMGLLSCAPVVDDRHHWIPVVAWERITRDAGIVRGREEWWTKLARYSAEQRQRAQAPVDAAPAWLAERHRDNAEHAQRLRAFVGGLIRALDDASRMRRWHDLAEWCRGMLARRIERVRDNWPQVEIDAAERVDAALDRLACLDAVEARTDLPTFRRALQLELDDDLGRVGQLGHGVLVGTPASALGVDLDVVIVLGMAEGVAPTRPREDSLLPDLERRVVADELRPRDERIGVEHRHLLAALAGAKGRRIMIHPRGDLRRNVQRAPSRWLLDGIAARTGPDLRVRASGSEPAGGDLRVRASGSEPAGGDLRARALPSRAPWLETVPSFAGRMRRVPFPATHQEHTLRRLAAVGGGAHLAEHPAVTADPILRRGVDLIRQRHGGRFGRFTGRLTGRAAELVAGAVGGRIASAAALEAWLSCPHAYLLQQVLRVKPVENPEELLRIDPLEQGSLVHGVLERWLCEVLDANDPPAPTLPWPPAARERLLEIAEDACRDAEGRGVTGHPLLWRRDRRRLLLDFAQFLVQDDRRRRELALTPIGSELAFGMDTEPLRIDVGDGLTVRLRGRIDRVDRAADGTIVVADYKTGGLSRYRGLTADSPLADGTRLQLPIYGLAIRDAHPEAPAVRTEYWFVSTRGRWERIGYALADATVTRLRRVVGVIANGIASGLFPMRPPAPVWRPWPECDYCDPDGLGTSDHYREWERIRTDPALLDYLAVVEPDQLAGQLS